ncbi:MAG: bifunctional precorrin-2 dehydrogenase/sirohydrochlorin ferrochelatase [Magnetococcales bacterium]|nr:bifunctional precorrin-2 dehydrogenase/sirohydrochlorin ferrochelatase [Magnetococcales bacterium]MBF0151473.1 bifunctional precorrin-2 dehydrogenase/sirohydrochlorin ferrochelatase [Magnetococcales bacterium]MBF0173110.1 bifunctional precorrin-2 dehydrogenase/sirohydrochlorin ferrochelatase [Magnetococcales bacterium]MBF0346239.1 bifunctional precorrin-2 dehydrogenase/sirohydrochlorin ferrochelatase [Magnetococcales bacterium]MBF0632534.1 bifunctional precorrin-2 dehydrogenase/sirohydrochlo
MEHPFLPLFLDLRGKACLLVGSGDELLRKGNLLLDGGALLRLVSPREMVSSWPQQHQQRITWIGTTFQPHHLDGVWLVVSTHASHPINQDIRREAERRGIFVNVVDQPEFCSAIWPAMIARPPVCVAIATSGTGPALSGWLGNRIAAQLPDDLGDLARWFARWRKRIAPEFDSLEQRGRFWKDLFSRGLLDRFLAGDRSGAEAMIRDSVSECKKSHDETA